MGTTLALTGAYVLAGELSRHDDHRDAFHAYESIMRPFVRKAQKLPPGVPRLAHPRTRRGVRLLNTAARLAATPAATRIAHRLPSPNPAIPDYTSRPGTRPTAHRASSTVEPGFRP
jgi:2-polyprenyl-6-methoxyphenol hydroxylase-like FAD-dependent oxidoreductase